MQFYITGASFEINTFMSFTEIKTVDFCTVCWSNFQNNTIWIFSYAIFSWYKVTEPQNALGWKGALKSSLVPALLPWKGIITALRNSAVPTKNQCYLQIHNKIFRTFDQKIT